uniref:Peptidase S1 domain-containing protein n=1 Tax=Periophthalmus magnuspinnatus TaxID=409849 RepID=A0A3B4B5K7_9GOBI
MLCFSSVRTAVPASPDRGRNRCGSWVLALDREPQYQREIPQPLLWRHVWETRCHPEYNTTGKMENDICLLRLSAPVHFMPHIQPMCLAAQGSTFPSGFSSWVAGWGVMDEDVADTLQEVELPIVGLNECRCLNEISIPDKTICAGFKEGGRDSCSGDSGGPLIVQLNSIWVQVGVVSFGQGCAHANLPGAYALVPEYQKWISLMVGSSSEPSFVLFAPPDRDYDEEYVCQKKMTTTLDDDSLSLHSLILIVHVTCQSCPLESWEIHW